MPWIKASDIQPSIKGSDHCPVFVDFHDEITTEAGEKLVLREMMHVHVGVKREPPRLAAKFWPEFQGKQMLVSSFFTKRGTETKALPVTAPATDVPPPIFAIEPPSASQASPPSTQSPIEPSPPPPTQVSTTKPPPQTSQPSRRRPRADTSSTSSKPKKLRTGQSKLSSFFTKPPSSSTAPKSSPPEIVDLCESEDGEPEDPLPTITSEEIRPPSENTTKPATAASWSALFTPVPPPLCSVHGEPAKAFRVNKPGPNKGRTFYLCARPVGPGYDKGRSERLREEVNHQYKCDFFKWASDVKREAMRSNTGGLGME